MSGDGRDESLSGAAGPEADDELSASQVPNQGGRGDSSGGTGSAGQATDGAADVSRALSAESAESHDHYVVPQQRKAGSHHSVLSPPRELPPADAELILHMRDGDDSAYEELFRRHADAVRRYARTCCRDADTADDLTAEVFARTLQAVRGGAGPEQAVRAYLLTTVRRVAANWMKTAKREQLVEDFAAFAMEAARSADASNADTLDLGADVRAMREAERSLAMQAFRSLPERWQAVLWHTTVEEESPSDVAPLFGLTANATAVLASRAREGLKQAYLQAHVSTALTTGGDCARYADRLGAYARGGLRMRAERGLRKHLDECVKCRLAAGELAHVNAGIPALLPVAMIGWFAAGYSLKAAGIVAGGAAGAAGAGAAAATGGAARGTSGGAAAEGLGAPAKVGTAAAVAAVAAVGLVWALFGDPKPVPDPVAKPPIAQPMMPPPAPEQEPPAPPAPNPSPVPVVEPVAAQEPTPAPPRPTPPKPSPTPEPPSSPTPTPSPTPRPTPTPPPPPAPEVYQVSRLNYGTFGDHTGPEVRLGESSWLWQRSGMSIGGTQYAHGATVHAKSSITIDLNRRCTTYEAFVGIDDLTRGLGLGAVRFSVYGDGTRLWSSPVVRSGEPAVPVHVPLTGRSTIRLVAAPETPRDQVALADWAESRITCE
ncbi:sigma-70 family RNA polymerase sigma factor [Streptomyces sp. NPDC006540]|uniref:sigma-70 family RNA polymerase sigma factor n=1 Tax=Streptomyces sp. NPDC006540 TaxID=3155353 RepID=UPI0033BEAB15